MSEDFKKWLNRYLGRDEDDDICVMDIPEDEFYELEDLYREETGNEVI